MRQPDHHVAAWSEQAQQRLEALTRFSGAARGAVVDDHVKLIGAQGGTKWVHLYEFYSVQCVLSGEGATELERSDARIGSDDAPVRDA